MTDKERTIAFADLSGFTALTEAHGDEIGTAIALRFYEMTRSLLRNGAALVKTIGDAVMIAAPDPTTAVAILLELQTLTDSAPNFPMIRAGLHVGAARQEDHDYFGASVYSVAKSRLASALWRSALLHVAYGVIAILATLAIAEWMLRRHVFSPLALVERQLNHVGAGHGWLTLIPETDRELDGLASSVRTLGPSLERQVWEWIEADRRANGVLLISRVRGRAAGAVAAIRATVDAMERGTSRADLTDRLRRELEDFMQALSDDGSLADGAVLRESDDRRRLRGSGR